MRAVAAEAAVRAAMLTRPDRASVTGAAISDLARVTRAEGLPWARGIAYDSGGLS